MTLTDKRTTLKGYLSRYERQMQDIIDGRESISVQDAIVARDKLIEYESQLIDINQKLLALTATDGDKERSSHSGVILRVSKLREFFTTRSIIPVDNDDHVELTSTLARHDESILALDDVAGLSHILPDPNQHHETIGNLNLTGPGAQASIFNFPNPTMPDPTQTHYNQRHTGAIPKLRLPTPQVNVSTAQNTLPSPHSVYHTPPAQSALEIALAKLIDHSRESDARHREVLENMQSQISMLNDSMTSRSNNTASQSMEHHRSRLPALSIPEFHGDPTHWKHFQDMFTSIVEQDPRLTKVQKLQYLMTYLKGNAHKLVSTLAITEENYDGAWNILKSHYDNNFSVVNRLMEKFYSQTPFSSATEENIEESYTICSSVLNSMDALELKERDPWIISFQLSRMDAETRRLYAQDYSKKTPSCTEFLAFLNDRLRTLQICKSMPSKSEATKGAPSTKPTLPSFGKKFTGIKTAQAQAQVLTTATENSCPACQATDHKLFRCPKFLKMNESERLLIVKRNKLCRKCITSNHMTATCTFSPCKKCNGHHNSLLHDSFYPRTQSSQQSFSRPTSTSSSDATHNSPTTIFSTPQNQNIPPSTSSNSSTPQTLINNSVTATNRIFLETAVVHVLDKNGIPVQCRALLDNGSQANLIAQSLFQKLKLPRSLSNLFIGGVMDGGARAKYQADCSIRSLVGQVNFDMTCHIVPSVLGQRIPNFHVNKSELVIPDHIALADPTWDVPQPIELLISNELYNDLMSGSVLRIGPGLPVLKESCLGWIVSGPHNPEQNSTAQVALTTICPPSSICGATTLQSIDNTLKKLLEAESLGPPLEKSTPDHAKVEEIFVKGTTRNESGRYVTRLPFKPILPRLGTNLSNATIQFNSLERKLSNHPQLRTDYNAAMQENFDLGFFEEVPPQDMSNPCYYLPHHCVVRTVGDSTKMRIVMNASSKSETGLSLNDVAMMGPTVQPDLLTVLLRFRMGEFAFTCDIRKMYPQILIHPEHRDYHRILWRSHPEEPLKHYRAKGVCFGVTSSPFLATRVLVDLAISSSSTHPLASQLLHNSFYVDDCLASFSSLSECKEAITQINEVLNGAGMELSKWNATHDSLLPTSLSADRSTDVSMTSSTLGLNWNSFHDQFTYKLPEYPKNATTKREVLSSLATLYDPLGLVGPINVHGKLILQKIHKAELGWDATLPPDIQSDWAGYSETLPEIRNLTIPRWISNASGSRAKDVHVFCDASNKAFGAVAYLVSEDENGLTFSNILMAKSRVAPVDTNLENELTIPRLELCAALLGAEVLDKLKNSINFSNYHLWSDSTVVLGQLRSRKVKLNTYVQNRVNRIHELTDISAWNYVPTDKNPADIISRGMWPRELLVSILWWKGPQFIIQTPELWPKDPTISNKKTVTLAITTPINTPLHPIEKILARTHSFLKTSRILAYILRFSPRNEYSGPLSPFELNKAEKMLVAHAQDVHLAGVKASIEKNTITTTQAYRHLWPLSPFLDECGLIRVGGRLERSNQQYDVRHPILLPNCPLATMIATQIHQDQLHPGPQLLLAIIRQRFWPLGGRRLTRKVTHSCVTCARHKPTLMSQMMADLPPDRVTLSSPFTTCSIDFCGPILSRPAYKRGGVAYKTYVCAFVCFATKAVHLEVVGNLSADSFIAALRRFTARRSTPSKIYCDNAGCFRGADTLLRAMFEHLKSEEFQDECTRKGLSFQFMPPRSPHHGGLHEAAIKSLKHHLKREVGQTVLTFEELSTVISQIEAILNSRPITPLSDDPNEPEALTPGHFLVGKPLNILPEVTLTNINPNTLSRWQLCQSLLQHFAERWRKEYLHTLQNRKKWFKNCENLKPGDFVVLFDQNTSPSSWPMGIIEHIHPGDDHRVRVVTVRTARGIYDRAVQKVAKLPLEGLPPSESAPGACCSTDQNNDDTLHDTTQA
ncbi:hypothetical protein DMENIID0001_164320 [Sergentomyia squamirostris]